VINQPI